LEIYLDERAKKEKEIAGLRAKVAPNSVEKEEHYKTLVSQIVTDLKMIFKPQEGVVEKFLMK